ncbi:receptor kinase-like protein Xa21 [Miscanthus floridulus]|uniref:receptor kinase-like protein Xa21 n=1 Tax=Miscanthus floridulus TaxID=154761 RepID=UPI003457A937
MCLPLWGRVRALQNLLLTENKLEANDKEGREFINSLSNCSQLRWLILSDNSFGGHLPGSVVNLSVTLQKLYLDDNRISGSIPADIGNLVGLNILLTVNNSMSEVIPDSIGKLENLVDLGLYGPLPSEVGTMTNLNELILSGNKLSGQIPIALETA